MSPHFRQNTSLFVLLIALGLSACASIFGTPATPTSAIPTATPLPPTPTPPPLAAIVNGEWITESDFLAEVERYRLANQTLGKETTVDDAAKIVLDDLIAQMLLAQAARAEGLEINESDLELRIEALAYELEGADALAAWQKEHNYTEETFKISLKRAAEAAWMRDKITMAVPDVAEQVHARQILLYNEEAAQKVFSQLNAGANFSELAVLYDPNAGGELGWFPRGYLLEPELEDAAFGLETNKYSDIITTDVGFHILLVVERDEQHQLSPDAYLVLQEKALQDWLLQNRSESEIVLAP